MNDRGRDSAINYFKAFLVIGMILGHCAKLLTNDNAPEIRNAVCAYIDLITFSGFVFSFGYLYCKAYILKFDTLNRTFLYSSFKTLAAFYISAFCYRLLVSPGRWLTPKEYIDIVILNDIPPFSEFLLSFFVLSILFYVFYRPIKQYMLSSSFILMGIIVSLLMTFFPCQYITINQLGLIFGSETFFAFPIMQYLSLFLIGIYFAKENIRFNIKILGISFIGTLVYIGFIVTTHSFPERFPPSIYAVIGSWLFLYLCYLFSQFISKNHKNMAVLHVIGENTLLFLVLSNLFLFALRGLGLVDWYISFPIGIILIAVICYFVGITRKPKRREQSENARL